MKPIIFNTEMVKAILAGRKTVTRRVVKLDLGLADIDENDEDYFYVPDRDGDYHHITKFSSYQVGEILYVKETWSKAVGAFGKPFTIYRASHEGQYDDSNHEFSKWNPSICMPKEAARIFLKVTNIKVQRLQNITGRDAFLEGLEICGDESWRPSYNDPDSGGVPQMLKAFETSWDSTIKKKDLKRYSWNANPFVWVIEFEKIEIASRKEK